MCNVRIQRAMIVQCQWSLNLSAGRQRARMRARETRRELYDIRRHMRVYTHTHGLDTHAPSASLGHSPCPFRPSAQPAPVCPSSSYYASPPSSSLGGKKGAPGQTRSKRSLALLTALSHVGLRRPSSHSSRLRAAPTPPPSVQRRSGRVKKAPQQIRGTRLGALPGAAPPVSSPVYRRGGGLAFTRYCHYQYYMAYIAIKAVGGI